MKIRLTRDSVCAGDDIDPPHQKPLFFFLCPTIESLSAEIIRSNYLAQISGGRATWVMKIGDQPVAVVAQEWPSPKFLVPAGIKVKKLTTTRPIEVFFEYLAQDDPEKIYSLYRGA